MYLRLPIDQSINQPLKSQHCISEKTVLNLGNFFKCQKWIFAAGINTNDPLCVPLSFAWSLSKIGMQGHWPVASNTKANMLRFRIVNWRVYIL